MDLPTHKIVTPLATRIRAYEEFQMLKSTLTRREVVTLVSDRFGLTETTVYQWWKGTTPFGRRAGQVAKVPELLYVLGALLGDGCICRWRGQFQVWVVGEREFTAKFAHKLEACIGRLAGHHKYGKKKA